MSRKRTEVRSVTRNAVGSEFRATVETRGKQIQEARRSPEVNAAYAQTKNRYIEGEDPTAGTRRWLNTNAFTWHETCPQEHTKNLTKSDAEKLKESI